MLPRIGKNLRDKILLVLFSVGVIPLVVLGLIALASINSLHRLDVASIENNLISQKAEEIEGFTDNIIGTFDLRVPYEQVSEIELSQQIFLLQQLMDEFPSLEEVSFINLSGDETSKVSRKFPDGVAEDELQNQSRINKFLEARQGKKYMSSVYFTLKGPMITVASPVVNKNGVTVSVLAGEINLSRLQEIVLRSRLGDTGYVYIVDQDGFLVADSTRPDDISKSLRSVSFVDGLLEKIPREKLSNRYSSHRGENVVAEGRYLENLGLAVIAEWPVQDAEKVVITVRNQVIFFAFIVLVATVAASVVFAGRIVKPIKTLEKGTQLVAEGQFDSPVNIRTGDEIEDLGLAFNRMTEGLKRLEELRNEFIFIAAHELKTPVAVIKGYSSLILDGTAGEVSEKVRDLNIKISEANQRLIQLVNDLLQIGRAEAGKLEIKVVPVELSGPITSLVEEMKTLADKKNVEISYAAEGELPKVLADEGRLKEIMTNLVSNAVKYNVDSGKVIISHKIEGGQIVTSIRDTGLGISLKDQIRLFEKFYRVQTEKTNDIPGTGLGLFIVKQIIEKMNGKIWVESEEGKGSTFSFSLPIAPLKIGVQSPNIG